jgi:hypothetical protein
MGRGALDVGAEGRVILTSELARDLGEVWFSVALEDDVRIQRVTIGEASTWLLDEASDAEGKPFAFAEIVATLERLPASARARFLALIVEAANEKLANIDLRPADDIAIEQLAQRAYGGDVELRYLASGDEDCRETDVAIVREHESGFVQVIDREAELLPSDVAAGKALLRARMLDLLGGCAECGERHAEEGIAS